MCEQLDVLGAIGQLPQQFFCSLEIKCQAFAILTTMLNLVIKQVKYLQNPLQKPGRYHHFFFRFTLTGCQGRLIMSLVATKQRKYEEALVAFRDSIEAYNRAITFGHHKMDSETFKAVSRLEKQGQGNSFSR
jgi:hypothetical protein